MFHEYKGLCCQHWSYSALSRLHSVHHFMQCFIHFTLTEQLSYIHNIAVVLAWNGTLTSLSEWWSKVPLMSVLGMQKWGLLVDLLSRSWCHPGDHNKLEKWDNRKVQQSVQRSASGKGHVMNQHKLVKHLCREGSEVVLHT